jgi:hypothetical protein
MTNSGTGGVHVLDIFPNPEKRDEMTKADKMEERIGYEETENLTEERFPYYNAAHTLKKAHTGRSNKVSVENTLMITWEYRSCFHTGGGYGISAK